MNLLALEHAAICQCFNVTRELKELNSIFSNILQNFSSRFQYPWSRGQVNLTQGLAWMSQITFASKTPISGISHKEAEVQAKVPTRD